MAGTPTEDSFVVKFSLSHEAFPILRAHHFTCISFSFRRFFFSGHKKTARRAGITDNRTVSVEINYVTHFSGGYSNHPGKYRRVS